jgi:hypothetical protein
VPRFRISTCQSKKTVMNKGDIVVSIDSYGLENTPLVGQFRLDK